MEHQKIFERCKRNDARAQFELYNHFKTKIMGLCRRYANDNDDAQDILQESFIKIFTRLNQLTSVDGLEPWMKSIAVRTAIDHFHKKKRNDSFSGNYDECKGSSQAQEIIIDDLNDKYLFTVINNLPEGCRFVFNLFVVEGYNHKEISTLLGINESTSRSQLHYAKQLLKEKLNQIGIKRYEKSA